MGQLWSPLAAVTTHWQGKVNAQIAVAISAVSIVPSRPRVLVQIYKGNYSHQLIQQSGVFALNFLRADQLHLIKAFGFVSGKDVDKLSGIAYDLKTSGSPVLKECWGYLDCRVINAMDGGDMTAFLADVLEGDTVSDGQPLWWRDARKELPPEWLAEWDAKISGEIENSLGCMDRLDYTPWYPAGRSGA